ncbi:MAG: hypothetical protein H6710_02800 [Myxococcales bacterium]|nr:hypothetical protein [Myxococcales bacterium]MCB9703997.1 hypothetical protein [Myxococcales bacterium]
MSILLRAIVTGFGLKLGQDIYRVINRKLGVFPDDDDAGHREEDEDGEIEERSALSLAARLID